MNYPSALYPTIVECRIYAPKIRYESLDGDVMTEPLIGDMFHAVDFKPFEMNGKTWGLTHLQKFSTYGWIRTDPCGFHWWKFWKPQQQDDRGNWLPGTERGIYFRRPFSWRWDIAGTVIDGELRHWILSKGYLGGHWD